MVAYNKKRYLKLLKLKPFQGKYLTSEEELELNKYQCLLDGTLDWEVKEQYLDLLDQFISKKIDVFKFYIEFQDRTSMNIEVFDNLETNFFLLSPHEKSEEFSDFINEIRSLCHSYTETFESYEFYASKELQDSCNSDFRASIEAIYLKIQKFLSEE